MEKGFDFVYWLWYCCCYYDFDFLFGVGEFGFEGCMGWGCVFDYLFVLCFVYVIEVGDVGQEYFCMQYVLVIVGDQCQQFVDFCQYLLGLVGDVLVGVFWNLVGEVGDFVVYGYFGYVWFDVVMFYYGCGFCG